jgi:hypothetical protein
MAVLKALVLTIAWLECFDLWFLVHKNAKVRASASALGGYGMLLGNPDLPSKPSFQSSEA